MRPVPYITTQQMIEVDKLMMEYYEIELLQMMENAGFNLALLAKKHFNLREGDNVLVLAGTGGNAGGALVAARRLANWGMDISVILGSSLKLIRPITLHQIDILKKMNVPFIDNFNGRHFHLIIDGLIGYNLQGKPEGKFIEIINRANEIPSPILSLDIPSGMDSTTGEIYDPCINADVTMTLALPKTGFLNQKSKEYFGELYLADIGVPPELFQRMRIMEAAFPIFDEKTILKMS